MENDKLTSAEDWEEVMGPGEGKRVEKIVFSKLFDKHLKKSSGKALEIGCVPGHFLIYICKKFGYIPVGVDYLKETSSIMKRNFLINGLKKYEIYKKDFLNWKPKEKYDLVSSFGFIEHFKDPDKIVKKHLDMLKKEGIIVLEVPNFLGARGVVAKAIDLEFFKKHNTETMNLEFYRRIAKKYKLKTIYLGYYSGFAYYANNRKMILSQKLIYLPIRILGKIFGNFTFNNKILSSYVVFIGQKN